MKQFLEKNFTGIVLGFLILVWIRSCSQSQDISKLTKELQYINDSTYNKQELDIRLQIEGLKAEKRMIQATDRKMLDVQRQNEIDNELKVLEVKLKR
jgi:hypothetical protein